MYLARELTGLSLAEIARAFRRDHSTVLHGIRRISNDLAPDSPLQHTLDEARGLLDEQPPGTR
jgi:chromosomal replication initiator protein